MKRGRDKTNEDADNGHADGRPIIEIKTASKRSKGKLEKNTDVVEPPTKKLKTAPKKTKKSQASDAESEQKLGKGLSKRKKTDSKCWESMHRRAQLGGAKTKADTSCRPVLGQDDPLNNHTITSGH